MRQRTSAEDTPGPTSVVGQNRLYIRPPMAVKTGGRSTKVYPSADLGRIALAVSPANPDVVYAMVEGFDKEHGGFYRSENRGEKLGTSVRLFHQRQLLHRADSRSK